MIQSTKAIALVLVSSASVLLGYHAFDNRIDDDGPDDWGNPPATQPSSSHYQGNYHYYYGHRTGSGSGFFSSSGSRGFHGTSHGGFGSTGHSVGS